MSEQLSRQEQLSTPESTPEELEMAHKEHLEQLRAEAESAAEKRQDTLQNLEAQVEQTAKPAAEIPFEKADAAPEGGLTVLGTQQALKQQEYDRKMKQVRGQLSAPERTLSRVIHQPILEAISEVSGKTFVRPSGVLGGSLAALLGSVVLLYMAKHYGFRYNYLVFFLLFAGGFIMGLLIEMVARLFKHRNS